MYNIHGVYLQSLDSPIAHIIYQEHHQHGPMLVRMPSSSNVAKPESSALDDTHAVEGEEPMDGEAAESIRGAKGGGKEISIQTVVPNEIAVGHEPEVEGNWATIMTSSLRDACQAAQVRTLSVNIFSLGIWCHFVRVVGA